MSSNAEDEDHKRVDYDAISQLTECLEFTPEPQLLSALDKSNSNESESEDMEVVASGGIKRATSPPNELEQDTEKRETKKKSNKKH